MRFSDFLASFEELLASCPQESIGADSRYLFLSDLHMGDGGPRDDLAPNGGLVAAVLARWYLERGYVLVLNGDIEDLSKFKLKEIRRAWAPLYALFDSFAAQGRLRKIVGNHDLALLRRDDQPYELLHALVLDWRGRKIFAFHGHEASKLFVKHAYLSDFVVRYLAKPLKIRNTSISKDSKYRFKTERRIYKASKRLGLVSITGHTHRPLFESLSKYDSLRWSIEALLRDYASAPLGSELRERAPSLIATYRAELERLGRKERRYGLSRGLYEDGSLLIPCLFNSGCATGKNGITAIEIEGGAISLVHWTVEGRARSYIEDEAILKDKIEGTSYARYVLKSDGLDDIFARIELLA